MLIVDNQGLLLSGLLTVIMIISAPPVWSEPIDDVRVVVGGLVRLGYYKLDKSPRPTYQTSLKHDERDIENHLAKNLFAKWYYLRFGIGYRWLSYELEGSGEDVDQTLALNFFVPTFSVFLLDGHALHPKVNTRIGLIYGKGNSTTELDTKSSESSASETIDQTDKSSGDVEYYELFIDNVMKSGWGYRLGFFVTRTDYEKTSEGVLLKGSSDPSLLITLIKQF